MNKFEFITVLISSLTFILLGTNFLFQLFQYKKQNKINTLTGLLMSAKEASARTYNSDKEENQELNKEITKKLPEYYKELMSFTK